MSQAIHAHCPAHSDHTSRNGDIVSKGFFLLYTERQVVTHSCGHYLEMRKNYTYLHQQICCAKFK